MKSNFILYTFITYLLILLGVSISNKINNVINIEKNINSLKNNVLFLSNHKNKINDEYINNNELPIIRKNNIYYYNISNVNYQSCVVWSNNFVFSNFQYIIINNTKYNLNISKNDILKNCQTVNNLQFVYEKKEG